jgi:hypothetical protein
MRRSAAIVTTLAAALALTFVVALSLTVTSEPAASGLVGRGSAIAPVSITFKNAGGTTTTEVPVAADGTYSTEFGIAQVGKSTATIKLSDGTPLARIPITVTQAVEPCVTPTAGTGADWGVTHSPLPSDPKFPSYVTICGRITLTSRTDGATPAGTPPSLGTPGSVSRDDPGSSTGGVLHDTGTGTTRADSDDGFPWWVLVAGVLAVGVGVIVVMAVRRGKHDGVGST